MDRKDLDKRTWAEFRLFIEGSELPPQAHTSRILSKIHSELNPSSVGVFFKLSLVQAVVGLLTLAVCPQLGVGPVFGEHGLMSLFMYFGPEVCTLLCGIFYLGLSIPIGFVVLNIEEMRKARQSHLIHIPLLAAFSLMLLMVLGASGDAVVYALWLGGAIVGGEMGSRAVAQLRLRHLSLRLKGF